LGRYPVELRKVPGAQQCGGLALQRLFKFEFCRADGPADRKNENRQRGDSQDPIPDSAARHRLPSPPAAQRMLLEY
jgi:hypothetical protein